MFSMAFWAGTCAIARLRFFPPILLASSFHPLSRACSFASVLPLSLFALWFPFGVPSGAVRSEIDSESHGRVPWGAGWAPSSSSSLVPTYPLRTLSLSPG